jgi:hypothetical protein
VVVLVVVEVVVVEVVVVVVYSQLYWTRSPS